MLREFVCPDGTVYAVAAKVDDVITFLEKHRGKWFVNGAVEDTGFKADAAVVSCDSFCFWMENMEDTACAESITTWFDQEDNT